MINSNQVKGTESKPQNSSNILASRRIKFTITFPMKMKSLEEPISKVEPVTIIKEDRIQKEEEKKSPDRSPRKAPCLQDFTILSPLGRGAYGEVVLVKKNSNDKMYAMKITDKSFMKIEEREYQAVVERDVLAKLNHPGVVKMYYSFQDKWKLYLVMDYLAGGGKVDERVAKFFVAEIVVILEYLHEKGIAHRDLKPENLMLTEHGHLKAIDFATAKYFNSELRPSEMFSKKRSNVENAEEEPDYEKRKIERSSTFVGTAQYVAPELIEDGESSAPADLWALGCIIFLISTGKLPFNATQETQVFQQIKQIKIQWPAGLNTVTKNIIEKLLVRTPELRLGAGPPGSSNDYAALKSHPYFEGINFDNIFEQESAMLKWMSSLQTLQKSPGQEKKAAKNSQQTEQTEKTLETEKTLMTEADNTTMLSQIAPPTDRTKEIKEILSGHVSKKSTYLFYQLRKLVLTDEPRLKYHDPNKNTPKKEIPLNGNTKAQIESKNRFFVIIPSRKYTFKTVDHDAEKWVKAINVYCSP